MLTVDSGQVMHFIRLERGKTDFDVCHFPHELHETTYTSLANNRLIAESQGRE